ncbi:Hypothetical predicted protein [Podarcis lilfordi]|uniref:Uncharacterized protein n=1 Tax=Podarcis lilfordi TaxID=74358 RepID=A0AA35PA19_9SAUR|nr:Hypothetical predicted protein [Podarcis lilfordi]
MRNTFHLHKCLFECCPWTLIVWSETCYFFSASALPPVKWECWVFPEDTSLRGFLKWMGANTRKFQLFTAADMAVNV